jgi:hypothetical protein
MEVRLRYKNLAFILTFDPTQLANSFYSTKQLIIYPSLYTTMAPQFKKGDSVRYKPIGGTLA